MENNSFLLGLRLPSAICGRSKRMRKGPGKTFESSTVTHTHTSWPGECLRVSQASGAHRAVRHSNGLRVNGEAVDLVPYAYPTGPHAAALGGVPVQLTAKQDTIPAFFLGDTIPAMGDTPPGVFPAAAQSVPCAALLYARHAFSKP